MNFGKDKQREERKTICVMPLTLFLLKEINSDTQNVAECNYKGCNQFFFS